MSIKHPKNRKLAMLALCMACFLLGVFVAGDPAVHYVYCKPPPAAFIPGC